MTKRTGPLPWVPPRFGTPRNLDHGTLGGQVAEVSRRLGREPMPHQTHVWDVGLEVDADGRFVYDAVDLTIMRQSGKGLAEDTPLPTPDGWTTMGDLAVGDALFDERGQQCSVTFVSERRLIDCYTVTFNDGTSVVADGDHLWSLYDTHRSNGFRQPLGRWVTVATRDIAGRATLDYRGKSEARYRLPASRPLVCAERNLPVDPWLLGAWLGDGTSLASTITVGNADLTAMRALIEATGASTTVRPDRNCWTVTVATSARPNNLGASLRALGVWGAKHIPATYLRASVEQRLALLQGLMDTDGSVAIAGTNRTSRRCEFSVTNKRLAEGFLELALSLGIRTRLLEAPAMLNGREVGRRYRVSFTTNLPVFRLPRKAERHGEQNELRPIARNIRSVTPTSSVATRCIQVDAPSQLFLCGTSMVATHNTTMVFDKKAWRLTVAPNLTKPDGKKWGRQRALFTAQRRADARKKLEQEFAPRLRDAAPSFREITNAKARPVKAHEWKLSLNNGAEHLLFGRGNYLQIDAPVADAGHSDSLDDVSLDEVWAYANDDVEQGVAATMATRWNAQMWRTSTAGTDKSFYMWPMVRAGREHACTCGARLADSCTCSWAPGRRTAYFEWSLPDGCDIDDEALWWLHMPALGRTISPEFLRSQLEKARGRPEEGGEDLWRRGYGNQWCSIPLLGGETRAPKLPPSEWQDSRVGFDETPTMAPGRITLGFDVSPGGEWSSIAIATGSLQDPYVELVDHEVETGWLPSRLIDLIRRWRPTAVGFDQGGPAGALADVITKAIEKEHLDTTVLRPLPGSEYRSACGAFFLDVKEGRLRRADGQGPLDAAGGDATDRRVGDTFVWDRRTATVPISPLVAVTVARSLLAPAPADPLSQIF
jgi:hypothetical protein